MTATDLQDAIFVRDGEWLVPTAFSGGPWNAGAQHGGAVAGLLARSVESCSSRRLVSTWSVINSQLIMGPR